MFLRATPPRITPIGRPVLLRAALDQLDPVAVWIAYEGDERATLAHLIFRALGLDSLGGQLVQRRVDVVHRDRDVAVAGAELVGVDAEVVRQGRPMKTLIASSRIGSRRRSSNPSVL